MKYAITHCYTDQNKGDAAIIVSTTQLIRKQDPDAVINMYSTFGPNDKKFHTEHEFVSQFANKFFPGLFYQPEPVFFKNKDATRIIHFMWIVFKFSILLILNSEFINRLLFSKSETEGIREFMSSDIIISKGGSYLTSQNSSLRQTFSLVTMLFPFFLAKRYRKKIVIFSQSLGPVVGGFNKFIFRKALENIEYIFLREKQCIDNYDEVKQLCSYTKFKVIPDSAFYLNDVSKFIDSSFSVDKSRLNVGITLVDHAFKYINDPVQKNQKINAYKESVCKLFEYLINTYNASIHIFPQVIVDNSHLGHNDVRISKEIENIFQVKGLDVRYYHLDLNPIQLRYMYSHMDVFVGTRLHSVIFSLSKFVPAVNISYHGTKSVGIFSTISGFEESVLNIDDITSDSLINSVEKIIRERNYLSEKLRSNVSDMQRRLDSAMSEVVNIAKISN